MSMPSSAFCTMSARLGRDPLQVQGPGGNTSMKDGNTMWIKASGTELADAEDKPIFVAVDRAAALAEAHGAGDGTCKATVLDPDNKLRPSIETTFHALLDSRVVAHTHSVATIVHAISEQGRRVAAEKLADLPVAFVPYRKPGLPLTEAIISARSAETRVIVLENHGLVCAGDTVDEVSELIAEIETRLMMPQLCDAGATPQTDPPEGYEWMPYATALATDPRLRNMALSGSYYPDHVVFLGAAMPVADGPAIIVGTEGVAVKKGATTSQIAMTRCLADVLSRLPEDWTPQAIGPDAEAELLNWDAEKYRQALAAKSDG